MCQKSTTFASDMKKSILISIIIPALAVTAMALTGCNRTGDGNTNSPDSDSIARAQHPEEGTLLVVTMPEGCLWGHLGEDTGMSILEFITDNGDTLYVYRTDEKTGKDGQLMGSIRNYTDHFCLKLTPDSQTLIKGVNVTELQDIWSSRPDGDK